MSIKVVDHAAQEDYWTNCVCCARPLKVAIGLDGECIASGWYGRRCAAVAMGCATNKASLDDLELTARKARGVKEAARVAALVGPKPRVWGERAAWYSSAFALTTIAPQSVEGMAFSSSL